MDPHDEILGDTPAARGLGHLDRVPEEHASVDLEPVRSAHVRGPAASVSELVAWLVGRPDRRTALSTRLASPDTDPAGRADARPLVDRLLDRCRREVDERELEQGPVDLAANLDAACTPVAAQGVDVAVHLADDVPGIVHVDGDRLQRVVGILAASSGFGGVGRHVEARIERAETPSTSSGPVAGLRVRVAAPSREGHGASRPGRAHGLSAVDALAIGVCEVLVAHAGGSLAAQAEDRGPRTRFTLPTGGG